MTSTDTRDGSLSGKVALVTGGSRGIGAAIARRLAREGAAVAITYHSSPGRADGVVADIESEGGRAVAIAADSGDAEAVRAAVTGTVAAFGRLDVLVNNAGVGTMGPLGELTVDDFDRDVAVNVRAVWVASQEALRHLGDGGRIISIGSVFADRMPFPNGTTYALTKAAVAGFTRALARELGPRAITVNNVQPGPVATDTNPPEGPVADVMTGLTPASRYATPDEVTGLIVYLAGPEAAYVTGATINIDGGFTT
ncbi:3-oxoacyl-ACP reductase family protein [Streptomyces spectabilis]|uniref:3-oxoacyl-ACP reductase FabG n=1 Tax=Streptomyces spectabilis TaxID=68270 RepID=A0A516RAN2_STRST|nr:3-oxoacyl-ACP reductase family protein [Streptomyces spectabilis]QDQ12717.1 3-oxoacyl-ACP reductase FabG [Streptomyces spectabilis]